MMNLRRIVNDYKILEVVSRKKKRMNLMNGDSNERKKRERQEKIQSRNETN